MLDEWNWTEHFAPQPETERYIRFMCGKLDLWNEMQFNTRISSAHWMADDCCWKLYDDSGKTYTSRFLITGLGLLSNPTLPNVPGVEDFKGTAYHTSRWPKEEVKSEGKRVGIIGEKVPYPDSLRVSDETSRTAWTIADHSAVGTGATAIQTIPMIAKTAESLTVFQRTANWVSS
jgi:cation diffusion facilitator CzcD-associated flavoprotein CzcO